MKTSVFDINGKEKETITLPECFTSPIRGDIVTKILEAKKIKQPYGPFLLAGKQQSARGKIRHRRHVWQTSYGRGMSRVPRKVMSRRGDQFSWVGAEVPNTRGGSRAHPPKPISMINDNRINKKEIRLALMSAISATANEGIIKKRYESIKTKLSFPLVVEDKVAKLKIKELKELLKKILKDSFEIVNRKRVTRAGRGKMRGRRYKSKPKLLIVYGGKEKLNTNLADVVNTNNLSVTTLAKGGLGRLTVYTEEAIKQLGKIK
jgi:large subunit ribosomal protein L4e